MVKIQYLFNDGEEFEMRGGYRYFRDCRPWPWL